MRIGNSMGTDKIKNRTVTLLPSSLTLLKRMGNRTLKVPNNTDSIVNSQEAETIQLFVALIDEWIDLVWYKVVEFIDTKQNNDW